VSSPRSWPSWPDGSSPRHRPREIKERIEALTDELAASAYDVLAADELDQLVAGLEPIAAALRPVDY
jgi:hypothetical protein